MARLMHERESTLRHLNLARRHMRLCKQVQGADSLATAMQPRYDALLARQSASEDQGKKRENARDDLTLADTNLDNAIRTLFERCRQADREQPADRVLSQIFRDGKFREITALPLAKMADAADAIALRLEQLPEAHPLRTLLPDFRAKIQALRQALAAFEQALREEKAAGAEEDIAKGQLRQQYELNYFDACKTFGKAGAERLFPEVMVPSRSDPEPPAPVAGPPATASA